MDAREPPMYSDQKPDDHDERAVKWSLVWSRVQSFLIIAVVVLTIAELALAVQDRGLARKALGIAKGVNGTANTQVSLLRTVRALH